MFIITDVKSIQAIQLIIIFPRKTSKLPCSLKMRFCILNLKLNFMLHKWFVPTW